MSTVNQESPPRLYNTGTVGMTVVLDHVDMGTSDPFSGLSHPAFFTITEVYPSESPRFNTVYTLRDTKGRTVSTSASSVSNYLIQVDEWQRWRKARTDQDHTHQVRTIATLRDRLELLKEIMASQGVRVISTDQAATLGIKP